MRGQYELAGIMIIFVIIAVASIVYIAETDPSGNFKQILGIQPIEETIEPICTSTAEICDGVDNDCDGNIDNGNLCSLGETCVGGTCTITEQGVLDSLAAWTSFKGKYGSKWKLEWNEKTQTPKRIDGFHVDTGTTVTKYNIDSIATNFINENNVLFRIDTSDIVLISTTEHKFAPFSNKIHNVAYKQQYQGLPVYNSHVTLSTINDKIVSFKANYYPDVNIQTTPTVDFNTVVKAAIEDMGLPKNMLPVGDSLIIFPLEEDAIDYKLAWKLDFPLITSPLTMWTVYIDAQTGEVIYKENRIITESVSGTVTGKIFPEHQDQTQIEVPFEHESVNIDSSSTLTNDAGFYNITNISGTGTLLSNLQGPWLKVYNEQQPEAEHLIELNTPTVHDWFWGDYDTSYKNEESNVFYHINIIHDYMSLLGVTEMDYRLPVYVNFPASCNAFYCPIDEDRCIVGRVGPFLEFFHQDSSCDSTALSSDVIYHEYIHGVVEQLITIDFPYWDETGNMNEAWADYFACSMNDNPCLAEGFAGLECLRSCENTMRYPEDYSPEPHTGSGIISGSIWDFRKVVGANLADSMTIQAMRLMPTSFSDFLTSMITVDDDNGDLTDGTPHLETLCSSFYDNHGVLSGYCAGYTSEPLAIITEPLDGTKLEDFNDTITIKGTAYPAAGAAFEYYKIEYAPLSGPTNWIEIATSTTSVIEDVLAVWDISSILDKSYYIRLTVKDNTAQVFDTIIIQGKKVQLTGVYSDYGEDTNENLLYDYLVVEVGVEVFEEGIYPLEGALVGDINICGSPILNLYDTYFEVQSPGIYNIPLKFDGERIYTASCSGPYTVYIELSDAYPFFDKTPETYTYVTSSYSYTDFEIPPPDISGYIEFIGEVFVNQTINITAKLINTGASPIIGAWADLYDNIDSLNPILIGSHTIGEIPAFSSTTVDYTWTVPEVTGYYELKLVVGASNDADPTNNENYYYLKIYANISDVTGNLQTNDLFTQNKPALIQVIVFNDDYITAENVSANIFEYPPNSERILIDQRNFGDIHRYDTLFYNIFWTPQSGGEHTISLELSSTNDDNPDNNVINLTANVTPVINVTFHVTNSTNEFVNRLLGYGRDDYLEHIFVVNITETLEIPDIGRIDILVLDIPNTFINGQAINFEESLIQPTLRIISETYEGERMIDGIKTYLVYANNFSWDYKNTTITAILDPSNYPPPDDLTLYTCSDWDFTSVSCNSIWEIESTAVIEPREGFGDIIAYGFPEQLEAFAIGQYQQICGDVNSNGVVFDVADYVYLQNIIVGNTPLPYYWINGDLSGDGQLTQIDLNIFLNYFETGRIPTCEPNTYCSDGTPSGLCSGLNFCLNGDFVGNRCEACGCPTGQTCEKISGSWVCKGSIPKPS